MLDELSYVYDLLAHSRRATPLCELDHRYHPKRALHYKTIVLLHQSRSHHTIPLLAVTVLPQSMSSSSRANRPNMRSSHPSHRARRAEIASAEAGRGPKPPRKSPWKGLPSVLIIPTDFANHTVLTDHTEGTLLSLSGEVVILHPSSGRVKSSSLSNLVEDRLIRRLEGSDVFDAIRDHGSTRDTLEPAPVDTGYFQWRKAQAKWQEEQIGILTRTLHETSNRIRPDKYNAEAMSRSDANTAVNHHVRKGLSWDTRPFHVVRAEGKWATMSLASWESDRTWEELPLEPRQVVSVGDGNDTRPSLQTGKAGEDMSSSHELSGQEMMTDEESDEALAGVDIDESSAAEANDHFDGLSGGGGHIRSIGGRADDDEGNTTSESSTDTDSEADRSMSD